jgi:RNA polymerase sigma factor (sigma-70 family)
MSSAATRSAAFEQLALPLFASLYNHAFWLTRNHAEAEDLVQETFSKALRAFDSFQSGTNFKAWIFRILRNTFLTTRTGIAASRTVFLEDHPDALDTADADPTPEDTPHPPRQPGRLHAALEQLQPRSAKLSSSATWRRSNTRHRAHSRCPHRHRHVAHLSRPPHPPPTLAAAPRGIPMNPTPQTTQSTEHLDQDKLSAFIDGELPRDEQQGIERHLTACHACTLRVLSATQLKAATARAGQRFASPPEALARLTAQLRSEHPQTKSEPQVEVRKNRHAFTPSAPQPGRPSPLPSSSPSLSSAGASSTKPTHSPPNSSTSTSPPSPPERPRRSSRPTATPSNPGSRAVSPSASTCLTLRPYPPTPPSRAQTSPILTASPRPCFSSPSTNTRSPSSSPNAPAVLPSPRYPAPAQASLSKPLPHQTSASSPSATSTQPTLISSWSPWFTRNRPSKRTVDRGSMLVRLDQMDRFFKSFLKQGVGELL